MARVHRDQERTDRGAGISLDSLSADASERFKAVDAESYDAVSASFDKFTQRFSAPLARRMVRVARIRPGQSVLDLGTGTGVAALAAAEAVGTTGAVVGLDLSDGMLAIACANCEKMGLGAQLRFVKGDAERPDFPDQSFDAVITLFALLHLPNPDSALREMRRVLKPGGALVVGLGSGPSLLSGSGFVHRLHRAVGLVNERRGMELRATAFLDALVERAVPQASTAEMPEWTGGCGARPPGVRERICAAGFSAPRVVWEGHIASLDTPEEFWELQATYSSFARKRLATICPPALGALRREFDAQCRAVLARGGRLIYPYGAALFVARRLEKVTANEACAIGSRRGVGRPSRPRPLSCGVAGSA